MLAELKSLHEEVLAGIATLEAIVSAEKPDTTALAHARWQLTRVSRNRGLLLAKIYPAIEHLRGVDPAGLAAMRAEHQGAIAASSRHIAAWTPERILANWKDYQEASANHRAVMRARVAAEQATLYPLLKQLERA